MSHAENSDKGERFKIEIDKNLLQPDARGIGAGDVKAAQALNKNAHNGSAAGDQNESIQIIRTDADGRQQVVAQRAKEAADKSILKEQNNQSELETTASIIAAQAKQNPALEPIKLFKDWVETQPEGPEKEAFRQEVRQEAAVVAPELRTKFEERQRLFKEQEHCDVQGVKESTERLYGRVEKSNSDTKEDTAPSATSDEWLTTGRRIAALPVDQQVKIIGSGLAAAIEQYRHDEQEKQWGAIIGSAQGIGNVAFNLAKIADFSAYCIIGDHDRAQKMGEEFGTALGQTIVGGVRLFQAADKYLYDVGFAIGSENDYAKPFRDLADLGQKLDELWNQLPPREQERRKYEVITQMAAEGFIGAGGAQAIGKAKKFTEVLDLIAEQAATHTGKAIESSKMAVRTIANSVEELMQPEMALPGGGSIKLPRDLGNPNATKPVTHVLMSEAEDAGGIRPRRIEGGEAKEPVPERFAPSPRFITELKQVIDSLSYGERAFIAKHDIQIKPIRRVMDKFPEKGGLGACYDTTENTIYVAEEVPKLGKFVANYDLEFAMRHEFGHAYNAKWHKFGEYISESREFRAAFKQDIQNIPANRLEELQLSFRTKEQIRDEVFADMYAHGTGLESWNPRSLKMKELFPNCLNYAKTRRL